MNSNFEGFREFAAESLTRLAKKFFPKEVFSTSYFSQTELVLENESESIELGFCLRDSPLFENSKRFEIFVSTEGGLTEKVKDKFRYAVRPYVREAEKRFF